MPEKQEPPCSRVWIGGALIGAALLAAAIAGYIYFVHTGKIKRERLLPNRIPYSCGKTAVAECSNFSDEFLGARSLTEWVFLILVLVKRSSFL